MRRALPMILAVVAVAAVAATPASTKSGSTAGVRATQWKVTIENLTAGQPLSAPLFVVHSRHADVWSVGEIASHGVAALAEDANNAVLEQALPDVRGVRAVFTGAGGPIAPNATATYMVETRGQYDRLSVLSMLVNTNDAFTGLDSLRLGWTSRMRYTNAYDAGSERNNEQAEFIPGPCCGNAFVRDPEGRLIRMHAGILGVGDLDPAVYGWTDPVAKITIERM
jgi:Spondin_N